METPQLLQITLYGFLAGVVGTGAGGFLAHLLPRPKPALFSGVLGFAAGMMLAVIFSELLEEAVETGGQFSAIAGLVAGMAVLFTLDNLLPHHHLVGAEQGQGGALYVKKGLLLSVGIALHNLPEGLAIGAGFAASAHVGLTLALVLALHNIPEGLAIALPLKATGCSRQGIAATLLAGTPMGIGAWLGGKIGNLSPFFSALSLSFAAGGMLYIVCDELIPDAYETSGGHAPILGLGLGVVLGLLLTGG